MLVIKTFTQYHIISFSQASTHSYEFLSKKVQINLKQLASSIVNAGKSLDIVTLLYQYKFVYNNLALLYQ